MPIKDSIKISGTVIGNPKYDHEIAGERFYKTFVAVKRWSGVPDVLPCVIPEVFVGKFYDGCNVSVLGSIRTRNEPLENEKTKLHVFVFAETILEYPGHDENRVILHGYVCKEPIYRETPLGREIADAILGVNMGYQKSHYIPCIFWNRNALKASMLPVGSEIELKGRLQSREYVKRFEDGDAEIRVAYELSVFSMKIIGGE